MSRHADQQTPLLGEGHQRRESELPGRAHPRSILPTSAFQGRAQERPTYSEDGGSDDDSPLDPSTREAQMAAYRANAMPGTEKGGLEGKCAIVIQTCSVLFVVLIWALVLTSMPWPLPLFGYHPMLQSLGVLLLMQSILTLQTTSSDRPREKDAAFRVHRLINLLLVLPLFTAGASIMWYLHDQPGSAHFISWHGIFGTVFVAWAWFQVLVGIVVTSFDGKLVGGMGRAKSVWKWHRLSGYFLLPEMLVTAYLGAAQTSWVQMNGNTYFFAAVVVLLVCIASGLTLRIQGSKLPQAG